MTIYRITKAKYALHFNVKGAAKFGNQMRVPTAIVQGDNNIVMCYIEIH